MTSLFSTYNLNYANAVTSVADFIIAIITIFASLAVKREFKVKYMPYVEPVVEVFKQGELMEVIVSPKNYGHPSLFKLSEISLQIGDENYITPDMTTYILVGNNSKISIPCGHINQIGINKIREGRYSKNQITISFNLLTTSYSKHYAKQLSFKYEINVLNEIPLVITRPEWLYRN